MKSFYNIETAKSRGGYRVGYGGGRVWHIRGRSGGWLAETVNNYVMEQMYLSGVTLEQISDQLTKLDMQKLARMRQHKAKQLEH